MLCSDGNQIETTLNQILAIAKSNPDIEKRVYSSLESQLRHLQDIFFDTNVDPPLEETSHVTTRDKQTKQKKTMQSSEKNSSQAFSEYLLKRFGVNISHKELIQMAQEIGPKYGILISRNEKRSKVKILSWFFQNFDIMQNDINSFARNLAETKPNHQFVENIDIISPRFIIETEENANSAI